MFCSVLTFREKDIDPALCMVEVTLVVLNLVLSSGALDYKLLLHCDCTALATVLAGSKWF